MSFGPPSTPGRSTYTTKSTTPQGAPPTYLTNKFTDRSFTPQGEPPRSSRFGSSYNPKKSPGRYKNGSFTVPDDDEYDEDEDADGDYELDEDMDAPPPARPAFMSSMPPQRSPPRGFKRSHDGRVRENSGLATTARDATKNKKAAQLTEPDNTILSGERIISELDARFQRQSTPDDSILTEAAADLTKLWVQNSETATKPGGVGPESNNPFTRANYIASLLLQLHHPHTKKPQQPPARSQRALIATSPPTRSAPIPQALLEWLDTYHKPFPDDYDAIHLNRPSPSASETYWDVVFATLLRGRLDRTIRLLKDAGWEHADSALDDGSPEPGYHGQQLENIELVVRSCIRTLESCPATRYSDWDVKSMEWTIFRQQVQTTLEDLAAFAEGDDMGGSVSGGNVFQRSMGGADSLNLSSASRKAQSKVPWSIYDNLRLLYGFLLGQADDILMAAQDWLEGAIYLTVWWDGADESNLDASFARSSMRKSGARTREVDVAPLAAYRRRLADAFLRVKEAGDQDTENGAVFQPETTDLVHLGLVSVLEDQTTAVVSILRTWSMPLTDAVVELAALGNWLPSDRLRSRGGLLEQGLSKEDLLVLSYGPPKTTTADGIDRDDILSEYADQLSTKAKIGDKEGWELSIAILNRLEQGGNAQTKISDLLDKLQLSSQDTVDKVLNVCDALGQTEQRRNIAEHYADNLAENTQSYGAALIYYARAQAAEKLKSTISLLTSLCLLHSAAMPTRKQLDAKLDGLISKSRPALKDLGRTDLEAATLLSTHLSGYATLRKYYELRDQDPNAADQPLKSLERRRQAAAALFAVIKSAADCIPGGLYDPEVESVIPVDGLLALLGEALPFVGQGVRVFTQQQVFALLAILEDFVAAPGRIRENAESLLSASLGAYREETNTGTGPFKKTRSNLTESSSWEMLASQSMMAASQGLKKGETIERSWDWRQGLVNGGIEANEKQVVKLVREALVHEVAGGWGGKLSW